MRHDQRTHQIPADVPLHVQDYYYDNYSILTRNGTKMVLLAGTQMPGDIHGARELCFEVANAGHVNALEVPVGYIMQYAPAYEQVPYIVRLDVSIEHYTKDGSNIPIDVPLVTVEQLMTFKEDAKLIIAGVSLALHLTDDMAPEFITYVAQTIYAAHQQGWPVFVWVDLVKNALGSSDDTNVLSNAMVLINAVGADFFSIKAPSLMMKNNQELRFLKEDKRFICDVEMIDDPNTLLTFIHSSLECTGFMIGKNILKHPLKKAIAMTQAISSLVYDSTSVEHAMAFLQDS
jgi:DhnA family fructose-bisphosphate aldolase class Ia